MTGTWVSASLRTGYRNSWSPIFSGQYGYTDRGTVLSGTIRVHVLVGPFIIVWMAAATLAAIGLTIGTAFGPDPVGLAAWGFPAFGIALCHLGRVLARNEGQRIRTALRDALDAAEVTGDAPV